MSSKFSNLLSQARNRSAEEEEVVPEETTSKTETPELEEKPQPTVKDKTPPVRPATTKPKATTKQSSQPLVPTQQEEVMTTQGATRGRPRTGKSSDPNYTQITAYISKQTHKDMKLALLLEGEEREISELIEELLLDWLQNRR